MSKQIFYDDAVSSNAWRVSIYIREKDLHPDVKPVVLFKGEHKAPEYLKINPRGQVPAWQDGDVIIYESLAIMMYLEQKHPEKPLIPRGNDQDYATFLTRYFQYHAKLDHLGVQTDIIIRKKTRADVAEKIPLLLKELREWDKALEGREYLANTFSLADIALIPIVTSSVELLGLDISQFPSLEAWYRRMWERPSVKETCAYLPLHKQFPFEKVLEGARLN